MLSKFFNELRRRKVFQAGIAYVVGGWLTVQVADVVLDAFDSPDSVLQGVITLVIVGLPVALLFSWFFDISSSGITRTKELTSEEVEAPQFDRRFSVLIIALLATGLLLSVYANLRSPPEEVVPVSILIADFDNESGNALFSGVLEDFLLVGLEVAPFVNAYSRKEATSIAAQITGDDAESQSLNSETAALVALRQGVDIVIGGTVSRDADGLTVTVTSVSTGDQQELFSVTETVDSDADVLSAVVDISEDVRRRLGKSGAHGGTRDSESFAVTNLEAAAEYLKAQDLQLDRKLEEAVVHYQKALEFDPEFARAYAGLALTQQYLGNSDAAAKNWQETLSRVDRLTERGRLRTLGNYFMINQGNYDKALETYESLVEKYPADNVAQNNLAVTAFYAMDFDRAMEVGREVAARYPGHSGYGANYALFAMYASRFEEAHDVAESVIEGDPASAYALLVLALTSAMSDDPGAANDTYQRMTELDQFARSTATEGLADLAIYRGDLDAAVAILDRGIEEELALNAGHTVALKKVMRAEVLFKMNRRQDAQDTIADLMQTSHGDPAILVPAAMTLIQLEMYDDAENIATEMIGGLSRSGRAYGHAIQASLASGKGDSDAAIQSANDAVQTLDLWFARYVRAQVLLSAGRTADATIDLEVCQQRIGEGIAVFLNDRPSFRLTRELDAAIEASRN
jgi:tetratricopeptide (TPR) repeat protein